MMRKALTVTAIFMSIVSTVLVYKAVSATLAEAAAPTPVDISTLKFPERFLPQAAQAVFMLKPYTEEREHIRSGGTGFLLQTDQGVTVILTNRHICMMDESPFLIAQQGRQVFAVRKVSISRRADVCVVMAPPDITASRTPYILAKRELNPGDQVAVFGHPFLRPLTMNYGSYTNTSREPIGPNFEFAPDKVMSMARIDFMVMPGNSGSPVIDTNGLVAGIIFAMEGPDRIGLFVPLSEIKHFLSTGE